MQRDSEISNHGQDQDPFGTACTDPALSWQLGELPGDPSDQAGNHINFDDISSFETIKVPSPSPRSLSCPNVSAPTLPIVPCLPSCTSLEKCLPSPEPALAMPASCPEDSAHPQARLRPDADARVQIPMAAGDCWDPNAAKIPSQLHSAVRDMPDWHENAWAASDYDDDDDDGDHQPEEHTSAKAQASGLHEAAKTTKPHRDSYGRFDNEAGIAGSLPAVKSNRIQKHGMSKAQAAAQLQQDIEAAGATVIHHKATVSNLQSIIG